jgi:hypothetical protein
MTSRRALPLALALVAGAGLLAGCGSSSGLAKPPAGGAVPTASSQSMAGMEMPQATAAAATGPTATQKMVCDDEIKDAVKQVLQLPATPTPTSAFSDGKFTCTYDLPMGPLRLSVQHSSTDEAGLAYVTALATAVSAKPLIGLTEHAFGTANGIVLVLKDNETLEVDTTALPKVFGDQQQKRTDLAYELASDVLGCWTGHD